jgi:hypothetical protein
MKQTKLIVDSDVWLDGYEWDAVHETICSALSRNGFSTTVDMSTIHRPDSALFTVETLMDWDVDAFREMHEVVRIGLEAMDMFSGMIYCTLTKDMLYIRSQSPNVQDCPEVDENEMDFLDQEAEKLYDEIG